MSFGCGPGSFTGIRAIISTALGITISNSHIKSIGVNSLAGLAMSALHEVKILKLKYIAALIYGDDAKSMLDETVRYVILLLIFVFDPLAVLLLIAANQSYRKEKPVEKEKPLPVNVGKTIRSATVDKGVKKVTKERDGVKIHFYEEDDGKG